MENFSTILIRVPAFPLDLFTDVNLRLSEMTEGEGNRYLLELMNNIEIAKAIKTASPSLYNAAVKYKKEDTIKEGTKNKKLSISIYKYLSRMSSRSTPFGLFSGLNVLNISEKTNIEVESQQNIGVTRIDTQFLYNLSEEITEKNPDLVLKAPLYLNDTIYKVQRGRYRYIEYVVKEDYREFIISECTTNELLEKIIKTFYYRTIEPKELINFLTSEGIEINDCKEFILMLVKNQILYSELKINICGTPYLERLSKLISVIPSYKDLTEKVTKLQVIQTNLNYNKYDLQECSKEIDMMFPELTVQNKFQTDLIVSFKHSTISRSVVNDLSRNLSTIINSFQEPYSYPKLNDFKNAFIARYGDSEVNLLIALDPDLGIGYGNSRIGINPLIDDIEWKQSENQYSFANIDELKTVMINRVIKNNETVVKLTEKELNRIEQQNKGVRYDSDLCYALGTLHSRSSELLDSSSYLFELKGLVNGSAANLTNRFAYLNKEINDFTENIINSEADNENNWIDAELIHLNSGEANVIARSKMREYEVTLASLSELPYPYQIPVNDLYLSIIQNRMILRSKKHNKYIRLRSTSAHNFGHDICVSAYTFLCDLQNQNNRSKLNWNWGLYSSLAFLPRVEYKNIVISKARWILAKEDIEPFNNKHLLEYLNDLRKQGLPKFVTLNEGDNELLIDLDLKVSIDIIMGEFKNSPSIFFYEYINQDLTALVKEKHASYSNEIVFPFILNSQDPVGLPNIHSFNPVRFNVKEILLPFDDCLSIKIYCGNSVAESLLLVKLKPIINNFLRKEKSNYWFFIRYYDPQHHIRVRFFAKNKDTLLKILEDLNKRLSPYINEKRIDSLVIDTYKRELIRYGKNNVLYFEKIFFYDSELVVRILDFIRLQYKNEEYRVLATIEITESYLQLYFNTIKEKFSFCRQQKNRFASEFENSIDIKYSLKKKSRDYRRTVIRILNRDDLNDKEKELSKLINQYFERMPNCITTEGELASVIHMSINRLFKVDQRLHELFIYDLLEQSYQSIMIMEKSNLNASR